MNPEAKIDELLGSLGGIEKLAEKENAVLHAVDSRDVNIGQVVDNSILGLLAQKALNPTQVTLLAALLNHNSSR